MSNIDYARAELERGFAQGLIPSHMHEGLSRYVLRGVPPGSFMQLILANDFMAAAGRADEDNQRALFGWCRFLYNFVPGGCKGSLDAVNSWIAAGGLEGMEAKATLALIDGPLDDAPAPEGDAETPKAWFENAKLRLPAQDQSDEGQAQ